MTVKKRILKMPKKEVPIQVEVTNDFIEPEVSDEEIVVTKVTKESEFQKSLKDMFKDVVDPEDEIHPILRRPVIFQTEVTQPPKVDDFNKEIRNLVNTRNKTDNPQNYHKEATVKILPEEIVKVNTLTNNRNLRIFNNKRCKDPVNRINNKISY